MTTTKSALAGVPTSLADYRARTRTAPGATLTRSVEIPTGAAGPPTLDASALRAFFAAAAKSDRRGGGFHRIVAAVLARADRVPEPDRREWNRFLGLLERHRQNPQASLNCGVLANLVGIAAFGDDADFVTVEELSRLLGVDRLAAIQHRSARFIEPDQTFPITTVALHRMVAATPHPLAGSLLDSAVALLLEGIDLDDSLPVIQTEAELLGVVGGGSVLEWRHHFAMIAASPWSPYALQLADLAHRAACPQAAAVIDRFTDVCRDQHKEREREQVAEEVRRAVSESGVTQRQFAQWVGTSPSRLSTYVSGTVTPSASLMLRMTRTSRLLQERDVPRTRSTRSELSWGAARVEADDGAEGPGPTEREPGALGRVRSHLSAV